MREVMARVGGARTSSTAVGGEPQTFVSQPCGNCGKCGNGFGRGLSDLSRISRNSRNGLHNECHAGQVAGTELYRVRHGQAFQLRADSARLLPDAVRGGAAADPASARRAHIRRAVLRNGALVRHLESFGLRCVYAGDIATGQDALALDTYGDADAIITNPPYTRPLMHALISHFARILPTWLLLETDWASTKQAAPFMPCAPTSCQWVACAGSRGRP